MIRRRDYDWISISLSLGIILLFLPLFYRSYHLTHQGSDLKINYGTIKPLPPIRGTIYAQDKDGNLYPIALTTISYDVYFASFLSKEPKNDWQKISQIISLPEPDFQSKNSILLAKGVNEKLIRKLSDLKLDSLFFEPRLERIYPYKNFLEPILGFTIYDQQKRELIGKYGLERFYDQYLIGKTGFFQKIGLTSLPEKGNDLILSIDFFVQKNTETILQLAIEKYKAEAGLIVVADLEDGSIKALTEKPNYDPNRYFQVKDYSVFLTQFTQNFEPGSIIKPVTFLSALDHQVIDPMETYEDTGQIVVDGWVIRNFDSKKRGIIPYREALVQSLNVGLAKIALKLGKNRLLATYNNFRMSEPPFLDLPNLQKPDYHNLTKKHFRDVNLATISFGQGMTISPAKLLEIYSAFALKGKMISFHLGNELVSTHNIENIQSKNLGNVFSEDLWKQLAGFLESVVKEQARKADIEEFRIAGKTGSAYIPEKVGYSDDVITSFIGFFPVSKPKFLVMVKLVKPAKGLLAFGTAAPTFREVAEFLIKYYNLEPDGLVLNF